VKSDSAPCSIPAARVESGVSESGATFPWANGSSQLTRALAQSDS
jgi:hypothetical protein